MTTPELPLELHDSELLHLPKDSALTGALDLRCVAGRWSASLRLYRPGDQDGVNGFTDAWNEPVTSRLAALRNAYWIGRARALLHGLHQAALLPCRVPL